MQPSRYARMIAAALLAIAGAFAAPGIHAGATLPFATQTQTPAPDVTRPGKEHRRPPTKLVKKAKGIKNEYIVVLDDDVIGPPGPDSPAETIADALVATYGGKIREHFKHAVNGFTVRMTEAEATAMSADPMVAFVEQDSEIRLSSVESQATWGLDRIDQRSLPLNSTYSYTYTGAGVSVFVIDSGILTSHVEFGGRAHAVYDSVNDGRNGQDCFGHGTHVAGTIGGRTYGVAKGATLFAVRIFNCTGGTTAGAVAGAVNWVTAHAHRPAVVNMSLESSKDYTVNTVVTNSVKAGITYVVAAGNHGVDACTISPASAAGTITVGATDGIDRRVVVGGTYPWASNYGSCVDVWAPGYNIRSAWPSSTTATNLDSGTSMASPHAAGTAAIYLSAYPTATPANVLYAIANTATTGRLTGIGSTSPNRLLYSLLRP